MRITEMDLKAKLASLNNIIKSEKNKTGELILSYAYGGVELQIRTNDGPWGYISNVLGTGHIPKKELYYRMDAFKKGLLFKR